MFLLVNRLNPFKMKNTILLSFVIFVSVTFTFCIKKNSPQEQIHAVPFTKVHFSDNYWHPRISINRTVSIPSAFHQSEINGRFDNFALAGGLIKGEHKGDFSFDDTDPYKIIEGASYSLAVEYDPKLDAYLDSVISLIAAAQESDGYLTTCVTNKCERLSGWWGSSRWEKINSHELYNSGHLYEAAVAHFQATNKRNLLDVAIKNADLVCKTFGPKEGQKHVPSGHPIIEMALVKLYKVTHDKKYLDMARYFIDETGRGTDGHKLNAYSQDHKPILQQDEIVGHAVRAAYLYSGVTDVASIQHDKALFEAVKRLWDNMASKKLYITGGIGSRAQGEGFGPNYELHNHTAYCETCASIANVFWNHRMFLSTGESKYIDVLERALYNGVVSGVSLSGDKFFYDNPLESMGQHERQAWFGCACCPGNITRFMSSVPLYAYATKGDEIYVNMFVEGKAEIETPKNLTTIRQITEYPWQGDVKFEINPEVEEKFAIKFRIPGWAKNQPVPTDLYTFTQKKPESIEIHVNNKKFSNKSRNGYITIDRKWRKGDEVEIKFPMPVLRVKAHQKVQDDIGKLAIQRGPIVYCLEGKDQSDKHVFNKYIPEISDFEIEKKDTLGGVILIRGNGFEVVKEGEKKLTKEVPFTAIPYSVWNNRGRDEMVVWIPVDSTKVRVIPEQTIASKARTYMYQTNVRGTASDTVETKESAWGVNDQWEPNTSSDTSKPYHYWWLRRGTAVNLAYEFETPEKISKVEVYWLDFDHYDGNYRVPKSWKLYYKSARNKWEEVKARTPYTVLKDQYNIVEFDPITTKELKMDVQLQDAESGGVIEWKIN